MCETATQKDSKVSETENTSLNKFMIALFAIQSMLTRSAFLMQIRITTIFIILQNG